MRIRSVHWTGWVENEVDARSWNAWPVPLRQLPELLPYKPSYACDPRRTRRRVFAELGSKRAEDAAYPKGTAPAPDSTERRGRRNQ